MDCFQPLHHPHFFHNHQLVDMLYPHPFPSPITLPEMGCWIFVWMHPILSRTPLLCWLPLDQDDQEIVFLKRTRIESCLLVLQSYSMIFFYKFLDRKIHVEVKKHSARICFRTVGCEKNLRNLLSGAQKLRKLHVLRQWLYLKPWHRLKILRNSMQ